MKTSQASQQCCRTGFRSHLGHHVTLNIISVPFAMSQTPRDPFHSGDSPCRPVVMRALRSAQPPTAAAVTCFCQIWFLGLGCVGRGNQGSRSENSSERRLNVPISPAVRCQHSWGTCLGMGEKDEGTGHVDVKRAQVGNQNCLATDGQHTQRFHICPRITSQNIQNPLWRNFQLGLNGSVIVPSVSLSGPFVLKLVVDISFSKMVKER